MATKSYDIREEADGTWTIYNVRTQRPAWLNHTSQINKTWLEATYLQVLMNRRAAQYEAEPAFAARRKSCV